MKLYQVPLGQATAPEIEMVRRLVEDRGARLVFASPPGKGGTVAARGPRVRPRHHDLHCPCRAARGTALAAPSCRRPPRARCRGEVLPLLAKEATRGARGRAEPRPGPGLRRRRSLRSSVDLPVPVVPTTPIRSPSEIDEGELFKERWDPESGSRKRSRSTSTATRT